MNILGYLITIVTIVLLHLMIKKVQGIFINFEQFKASLKFSPLEYAAKQRESHVKWLDTKDYGYKEVALEKLDNEGYDKEEDDFKLLKKDLMKYIEEDVERYNHEKRLEPIVSEMGNATMNPNVQLGNPPSPESHIQPIVGDISLDSQYRNQWASLNSKRSEMTGLKTFKPDVWTYENENPINGGVVDAKSGLMAYDPMEQMDMVLQF